MAKRFGLPKALAAAPALLLALTGCSQLGAFNTIIPHDRGATLIARNVAYGGDARQTLDIYAPSRATSKSGVIVFSYGGSWNSGRKEDYSFVGKALASRGFVTVIFDYRLVPTVRYPAFVEDSAKAVAWTYRNAVKYGGDPERLFLAGHSAGAYNVMMVALAPEFLKGEGLSPSILTGVAGMSGPYDFLPLDTDVTVAAFSSFQNLASTQPVNRVTSGQYVPPMLLGTGDADTLVYPRNTNALAATLMRAGKRVETRYYPGIDHAGTLLAISRPLRKKAPVLDDIAGFFSALR